MTLIRGWHPNSIFLRPLTPLGMAASREQEINYTPEEFNQFYQLRFGGAVFLLFCKLELVLMQLTAEKQQLTLRI